MGVNVDNMIVVYLIMSLFRMDRTAFKAQTAGDAAQHAGYYKHLHWQERLRIALYLNSVAYNYPENALPRLNRTVCTPRSRKA